MNLKNTEIKTVCHAGRDGRKSSDLRVAYKIYGDVNRKKDEIVFTGMDDSAGKLGRFVGGSTLMFTEHIVDAICEAENKLNPKRVTFFDLQTVTGYPTVICIGHYRFNQLLLNWRPGNLRPIRFCWIDYVPEPEILDDFAEFIHGYGEPVGKPRGIIPKMIPRQISLADRTRRMVART